MSGRARRSPSATAAAEGNVAGIEIENSRDALVTSNFVTRNTGGILVFDLPSLPVMGGGNVVIERNLVTGNDTAQLRAQGQYRRQRAARDRARWSWPTTT